MFAERFDALMNIAEISNSLLGRDINMNPSHIGRLRSGARPLARRHDYLSAICKYLTKHIVKEYQRNALQKLTGISEGVLDSADDMAEYLENWLTESEVGERAGSGRLVSGFLQSMPTSEFDAEGGEKKMRYATYLYGEGGKRKAVEQFFTAILNEKEAQTIYLFSDENLEWLVGDLAFTTKWKETLAKIIAKGNRIKIIHDVSRNMNEMLEGVINWIPIYLTGGVEPYVYPRLRDGLFQKTLFIAPKTAAVISSSVLHNTDGMLNMFITDGAAVEALYREYEYLLSACRPLVRFYRSEQGEELYKVVRSAALLNGNAFLYCPAIPIVAFSKNQLIELAQQIGEHGGNRAIDVDSIQSQLNEIWEKSKVRFCDYIKTHKMTITLPSKEIALNNPLARRIFPVADTKGYFCSESQYIECIERLVQYEKQYDNLSLRFLNRQDINAVIIVKEYVSVFVLKIDNPMLTIAIEDKSMVSAFWDCALRGIIF